MSYEHFLKTALSKYKYADFTKNEIQTAIAEFSDLRPKFEDELYAGGEKKILLHLEGTIPVDYEDKIYNTPICVWILDSHPHSPPVVYVKPTTTMYIKHTRHVDVTGKVCTEYLKKWKHPTSDLLGLLKDLTVEFGKYHPLATIVPGSVSKAEHIAKFELENYFDSIKTKQDAIGIVNLYTDLRANLAERPFADVTRKPLLTLAGTIPVVIKGDVYNIPVCIYLLERHPYVAPLVYVIPAPGMKLNISRHVDTTGQVKTQYLTEWSYPISDLHGLLQDLTVIFGKIPPLYKSHQTGNQHEFPKHNVLLEQQGSSSTERFSNVGNVSGRKAKSKAEQGSSGQVSGRAAPQVGEEAAPEVEEHYLGSTEDFDIHCDPCNAETNFVEAEGYCVNCKEYYCKACLRYHRRFAATKSHNILPKDKMPKP